MLVARVGQKRVLVDVRFPVGPRRDTMLAVSVAELVDVRQKPAS